MSLQINSLSTEYVKCPVLIRQDGAVVDPTSYPVEMAFKTSGEPTAPDWETAEWESAGVSHLARCLVGPQGTVTLGDGIYMVWLKVTGSTEIPVKRLGTLVVL